MTDRRQHQAELGQHIVAPVRGMHQHDRFADDLLARHQPVDGVFFNPPGIDRTYSELEMIKPSLSRIRAAKRCTPAGSGASSRSGEKTGSSATSANKVTWCFGAAISTTEPNNAVFVDIRRPLPEIARNFIAKAYTIPVDPTKRTNPPRELTPTRLHRACGYCPTFASKLSTIKAASAHG